MSKVKRCKFSAGPFICNKPEGHDGDHKSIHGDVYKA